MKPLVRNIFLLFGLAAIVVMLVTFDDGHEQIKANGLQAGLYLPAVIALWGFIYLLNARAFQLIVNSDRGAWHMRFRHAYKLTLSGFAFSYTTPFGLGGSPYRMLEMAKYVGVPRAMSKVVLYAMMQILSLFLFWATGVIVFMFAHLDRMNTVLWITFGVFSVVLIAALLVFNYGYHNGLIEKLYCLIVLNIPFVKKPLQKFYDNKKEVMQEVDLHTSNLLSQPRAFWGSLGYEYLSRVISCLELFAILMALGVDICFADALLILAFSTMLGNILFFLPMELGAREGGVALAVNILGLSTAGVGVFASFFTRIRELFWIVVGVCLVKVGNKNIMKEVVVTE